MIKKTIREVASANNSRQSLTQTHIEVQIKSKISDVSSGHSIEIAPLLTMNQNNIFLLTFFFF